MNTFQHCIKLLCVKLITLFCREIVYEVCVVIVRQLMDRFVQTPQTSDDWPEVAAGFGEKWNFPHCIGRLCHFETIVCTHTLDMIVICSQGTLPSSEIMA